MSDSSDLVCPRCGAAVDAAVAGGNCPACLLRAAALGTGADCLPAMPWTPPSVDELASAFPQLEVLELIGHGGMGAVYKARQKSLGRLVALKILAPQHAANPDFAERFAREAKVLAEVSHPNIVTVHDFGQAGDAEKFYFLTMEFVDGVNLRQAMKAGRLTPQQALAIVPPICEALQFAHDRGIVHRDIKPENLLLDKEGRVKIADFGIARMLRVGQTFQPDDPTPNASQAGNPDLRNTDLTQESVLGTPSYMAPEQRDRPASVDHRADIFSLGVVLYEMLTGELPGSKLQAPSRKVEIDVRLDEIVLRALEQQPELRFQTAAEFRTRVTSIANGDAAKPRSARLEVIPLPATQPFSARTSGVLMLLIGAFFVLAFLFGGGVATSTQGGTAVAIFFASYFLGLLFPGLLVYQSAVASTCHIGTPQPVSAKTKWTTQWPAIVLAILWIPVSMVFFRSEAFATPIGQNAFLIFMGVCLAQFIPLGLGILHRGSQPTDESQLSQEFQPSLEPKFGQVDHTTGNVPRFMRCHVTDLQRLATFSGQFFLWRNLGQLVLTETQLTITQGAQVFAIPLAAIRDLSIGHYPLLVNWAGLDFISVTYEVAGQQRQLVLSPYESLIGLPSQFNEAVASWFEVIRAAVVTETGRAPARSQVQGFGTPASSRWTLALFLLMLTSLGVLPLVVFWNVARASGLGPTPPLRNWAPILPLLGPALGLSLTAAIFWWIRVAETRRKAAKERAAGTSGDADSMGRAISATTDTSPPNSTVADALGFRTLWGKRLFQWSHLGFLGFLCFLSFVPGFERALGFSGFFGFFGFVGFAVMVEHWHRRHETQSPHGQIANERSQRHKIAFAASVVWLVTGIMVGTVKLRATEVRFRYDFEWLALTLFLLATAVLPGVLVSKSIKQWREKRDPQDRPPLFGWLRATAVLGFVMTLPFVMLTTGLLDGLFSQVLVWEGAMIVFLLPVGVIGLAPIYLTQNFSESFRILG